MSSRHIWFWVALAAALFAFIFFFQRRQPAPISGLGPVLPELKGAALTAIQVRPATHSLGIRAERTNGGWQLTQPIRYGAQTTNIDRLVEALEGLVPATVISPTELRRHKHADEEYGFASPQAAIVTQQGEYRTTLLVGALTTPGDQVFLQVVGRAEVYVTDAGWLSCIPKTADDWRDTSVLPRDIDGFDRLAVTNSSRAFILQREPSRLWRMVWPLNSARADNARIHEGLRRLERLRIRQFVSDEPKADFESLGLEPPALELSLGSGTNVSVVLQIGKTVPSATNQVYARRLGSPTVFTIENEPLAAWRSGSVNDFRDPHLLTPAQSIAAVEVHGQEAFSVVTGTNQAWRVLPEEFPVDAAAAQDFVKALSGIPIVQFTKDVVNPPDLPQFGLATPVRQYIVKTNSGDAAAGTNCVMAELNFGLTTNQPDKVFVWRPDESSVYAISTNDFARLPARAWQLRDRKFWDFSVDNVAGITIRQGAKVRELVRTEAHRWSFAPGSQGIINDLAVEETLRGLAQTVAVNWVGHGNNLRPVYGLAEPAMQITVQLKDGSKTAIDFGAEAPSTNRYAGVVLAGQYWVLEFSWILFRDIVSYLAIP